LKHREGGSLRSMALGYCGTDVVSRPVRKAHGGWQPGRGGARSRSAGRAV
jgi:hypothetical protein